MDRLLSDDEIKQALQSYYEYALPTITAENREIAKAQLAKTDKWWIEQVERIFYNAQQPPHCWQGPDCGTECPRCVYKDWQTLKQEIGL